MIHLAQEFMIYQLFFPNPPCPMISTLARVRRQHTGLLTCFGHKNLKPWANYKVCLIQTENGGMEN